MKKIKSFISIMLVAVMALAMSMTAFAQTVAKNPADPDGATITINNPAKGETYSLYKLFDATTQGGLNGQIAYQTTEEIPDGLKNFFSKDDLGNVTPKDAIADQKDDKGNIISTKMTDDLKAALENWAKTATATVTTESTGDTLVFTGLPYGYYVMTTSHTTDPVGEEDAKSAITVVSTQPNAEINDKNTNVPSAIKEVEKESYSIGDTVKYTGLFDTTNYMKNGEEYEQVVHYVISDTLPEYLSNVEVTSIQIGGTVTKENNQYVMTGGTEYKVDDKVPQFDDQKQITIPWATKTEGATEYTSVYAQGAKILIKYEAKLTGTTNIGANDTNTISIRPYVDRGGDEPEGWEKPWTDTAVIKTYAAAIKKVDEKGNPLAGATFTIKGLVADEVKDEHGTVQVGVYRVVSYSSAQDAAESSELVTDSNGKLYIVGFAGDVKPVVTEFKAPDGYNKLEEEKELNVQKLTETIYESSGTKYYDKDGNLVKEKSNSTTTQNVEKNLEDLDTNALEIENKAGTLLPSTGGIGTTIFYIVGAILVIGAGIILVAKKRMSHEQ